MLISWKYNFLLLHTPKTGGTALTLAFAPFARARDRFAYQIRAAPLLRRGIEAVWEPAEFIEQITGFDPHAQLPALTKAYGETKVAGLFKIAFVRNPFTRAYSLYSHIRRMPGHSEHRRIGTLAFEEALPIMQKAGWTRQTQFVFDRKRGAFKVNFIGGFERLDEEVSALTELLGLPRRPIVRRSNVDPGAPRPLREAFGGQLDAFIAAHWREFEILGYSADIGRADEPPARVLASHPARAAAR